MTDESWYTATAYSMEQGNGLRNPAIGANDVESVVDARPPGTAIVIAAAFKLMGISPAIARLGSVFAGLGIVFLTYRLARERIGEEGAWVATLLVATDNLIVLTSRTARPEALTTLAILASLLAMARFAKRSRLKWSFLSGLLIAVGTMFHVTVFGYILSLGVLALVIDGRKRPRRLRGAMAYVTGFALGILPFGLWIVHAPMGRAGFRQEYLDRTSHIPLSARLFLEGHRYADLLGWKMIAHHGLENIPVRLPIPLLFLSATVLLWKYRRTEFYLEMMLLIPSILWLGYTVNKSSRYIAIVAPLFALAIGAAVTATRSNKTLHRVLLGSACLVISVQFFTNILLLRNASRANYPKVSAQLLSVIPPGEIAYGTITFWMALHDRPFISYERTDPITAAGAFRARYFITGDPMMTNGGGNDAPFYSDLNLQLAHLLTHGEVVGEFQDPYYGNLKVYKVHK